MKTKRTTMKKTITIFFLALVSGNFAQLYTQGNGVTDVDGNQYATVNINDQEWMQENLSVSKFSNGDLIDNITDGTVWSTLNTPAWAVYNNDVINEPYYGKIYNWYTVNDPRNVCPNGWHVPSDLDWKKLELFLGMTQEEADQTSWRGVDEGVKLKSDYGWNSNGNGTNVSGFIGLPGGKRHPNGNFSDLGNIADWWTSTGEGSLPFQDAYKRSLTSIYNKIYRIGIPVNSGSYIRCVNDFSVGLFEKTENLESIALYPNPTNSIFTFIVSKNFIKSSYSLKNITGKEVLSGKIEKEANTIDISNLEKGVYFMQIENSSTTQRVVKQ
jgi:uncharacterized protein (TIGR02145 family)